MVAGGRPGPAGRRPRAGGRREGDARTGPGARARADPVRAAHRRFQAVRHRLADTLVAIEAADAGWVQLGRGVAPAAAMAKALAGRGARTAARHCQQVLAGIGFTTEHDFHHYLRRVLVLDQLFGTVGVPDPGPGPGAPGQPAVPPPPRSEPRIGSPCRGGPPSRSVRSTGPVRRAAPGCAWTTRSVRPGPPRSVPPGRRDRSRRHRRGLEPFPDRRLASRHQDVTDSPGVAVLEQLLVVRRDLCLGQDPVGRGQPRRRLVVSAQAHRNAGHDPRSRPACGFGGTVRLGTMYDRSPVRQPSRGWSRRPAHRTVRASAGRARRGGRGWA